MSQNFFKVNDACHADFLGSQRTCLTESGTEQHHQLLLSSDQRSEVQIHLIKAIFHSKSIVLHQLLSTDTKSMFLGLSGMFFFTMVRNVLWDHHTCFLRYKYLYKYIFFNSFICQKNVSQNKPTALASSFFLHKNTVYI